MKGLVCTAIFGDRDKLHSIVPEDGVKYIADVDRKHLNVKGWTQMVVSDSKELSSPRMFARRLKTLAPVWALGSDWVLWMDGSHTPKVPLKKLIEDVWLKDADVALHKHPARKCAYAEAKECQRMKKDTPENIKKIVGYMKDYDYPENHGLHATPTIVRRVNHHVKAHARDWWECIRDMSVRDQTSFDFLCWRHGLKIYTIPGHCYESPRFTYHGGH